MAGKREERVYTIRQAAELTGASVTSLRIWLADDAERVKRFPNARKENSPIGEYWVIPESDLKGFELRGRGRPSKPKAQDAKKGKAK